MNVVRIPGTSAVVTLFVTSDFSGVSSERRFDKSIGIGQLKDRLEPLTGVPASTQRLRLFDGSGALICTFDSDDSRMLGFYPVEDYFRLDVASSDPLQKKGEFTDLSRVEKFELSETEYQNRSGTVRAFLQRNKLGKFAPAAPPDPEQYKSSADLLHVGDRCEVDPSSGGVDSGGAKSDGGDDADTMSLSSSAAGSGSAGGKKRGVVRFVGKIEELNAGWWVGVEYDEPLGKHDGSLPSGRRVFTARPNHGAFVRPNRVTAGDFPEEDPFAELEEDEM
ncbi:hypothetical protein HDU93_004582 [Gonapodya sp. JEL0774]|nr:hypothetical protein HDU93_004582 [Gonapodya sp. JEL0774]